MPYIVIDPATAATAPAVTLGAPRTGFGKSLLAMRTELTLQVGNRPDVTAARIDAWINDAYVDVCASLDMPELYGSYGFNTVIGQPFYLMPEVVENTRGVAVVDPLTYAYYEGRPLTKIDLDRYRRLAVQTDEPKAYFRENNVLVIWPTPTAVRSLAADVKISPQLLTNDAHCPFLSLQWHEVIFKAARAKAFSGLMEWTNAKEAENEWISAVRRKKDPIAQEDRGRLIGSSVPRKMSDLHRAPITRTTFEP